MNTMQARHLKLWFAGRSNNWPLAAYEVDLMMENFRDIAILYPNVPVADVEMLIGPTKDIGEAIKARDAVKFSETYKELTAACNSCHRRSVGSISSSRSRPPRHSAIRFSR
jgi:hypothetical protein